MSDNNTAGLDTGTLDAIKSAYAGEQAGNKQATALRQEINTRVMSGLVSLMAWAAPRNAIAGASVVRAVANAVRGRHLDDGAKDDGAVKWSERQVYLALYSIGAGTGKKAAKCKPIAGLREAAKNGAEAAAKHLAEAGISTRSKLHLAVYPAEDPVKRLVKAIQALTPGQRKRLDKALVEASDEQTVVE